ncbi:putative methyltransferase DDB_G0268948 [Strongylocentrotus purpuratus]|uniref:Methyltransferase type 11 domain-containing protein n=1 Tax=Strongylocentrotus purpuratus TaxID=7668 RepID=A0A7M7PU78_STRPU|nr:putative methyltransferase DDB_G0268948 [Strongylocentrotus purpuratus]
MSYRVFESSSIAKDYALYRPSIPDDVTDAIIGKLKLQKSDDHESLVVDIGCGSGQFTQSLARHFDRAIGYDISVAQIDEARSQNQRKNFVLQNRALLYWLSNYKSYSIIISEYLLFPTLYRISSAEKIPLESKTVDVVAVSQAAHWFDFSAFCLEADRVLRPGGHVVIVSTIRKTLHHDDPVMETKINECNDRYMSILDTYRLVSHDDLDKFYINLKSHYPETIRETIGVNVQYSPVDYLNLTKTMSYSFKYKQNNPDGNLFEKFQKSLEDVMETGGGATDGRFRVTFWHDISIGQKGIS